MTAGRCSADRRSSELDGNVNERGDRAAPGCYIRFFQFLPRPKNISFSTLPNSNPVQRSFSGRNARDTFSYAVIIRVESCLASWMKEKLPAFPASTMSAGVVHQSS